MPGALRNSGLQIVFLLACVPLLRSETPDRILTETLANSQSSAVVLDWTTGRTLAKYGPDVRSSPGSTLKPLLLQFALDHKIVSSGTVVYCRRNLRIAGRPLPCSHPSDEPALDAEEALAESCNTWFAEMGKRFTGSELDAALTEDHLPHVSMQSATVEQRELAVLGLYGTDVSPAEMAGAYRQLLVHASQDGVVVRGLKDSVDYGMADQARVPGVVVLGKTGTANNAGGARSHGWFVGAVPGKIVLAIYVPRGSGADAASLAAKFLSADAGAGFGR